MRFSSSGTVRSLAGAGSLAVGTLIGCGNAGPAQQLAERNEALQISDATQLDPEDYLGPSAEGSHDLALASDGTDYVVSWCRRNQRWIARFSSDGTQLDNPPVHQANECLHVAIAHGDAGYVIAETYALPEAKITWRRNLYIRHFSDSGVFTKGQLYDYQPAAAFWPNSAELALASAGDQMLLAYESADPEQPGVVTLRLNADSSWLAEGQRFSAGAGPPSPMLTFDGSNYLVAWRAADDIVGVRYPKDSPPLDSVPKTLVPGGASGDAVTALTADGGNFVISYAEQAKSALRARVLDSDLQLVGDLAIAEDLNSTQAHALAASGTQALVLWHSDTDSQRATFIDTSNATLSGTPFKVSDTFQPLPELAPVAGGYVAAWSGAEGGERLNTENGWQALISSTGQVSSVTNLDPDINAQRNPVVAFNGQSHLTVWQDFRGINDFDLRAVQIAPDGSVIDVPRALVQGVGDQTQPALAFNGKNFLLTWSDPSANQLMAAPLDASGQRTAEPRGIMQDTLLSTVASDGDGFLVVGSGSSQGIFVARADANGAPLGEPVQLKNSDQQPGTDVGVAWGGYYLVTWANEARRVLAARIAASGQLVDDYPMILAPPSDSVVTPRVAFGGGVFLVVVGSGQAVRLAPDGSKLDSLPIELSIEVSSDFDVSFDGQAFVVSDPGYRELRVVRIAPDGTILEAATSPINGSWRRAMSLSSACDGRTQLVFAGERTDNAERIFSRTLQAEVEAPNTGCEPAPALALPGGAGGGGGSGGSSSSTGGSGGAAGAAGASGDASSGSEDDGGCGCRTAPEPAAPRSLALLLAPLALVLRRRRWARR